MDLSIIIVNWNTRDYLRKCLKSILANPISGDHEIIVVENASFDGSAEMVRNEFPMVTLIASDINVGYAAANNQGVEASSGDYVLLLNPDTEITPGALAALIEFAKSHGDAAGVGCRLVDPDGSVQRSCRGFPEPVPVLMEYARLSRLFPRSRRIGAYRMTYFDHAHDAEVDQPMASCLIIPRTAWDDVGSFDNEFPIFFNEVDWCYRAREKGWKIYFTAGAEVVHHGGASTSQVKPAMVRESHRSLRRFYEKHYKHRISAPLFLLITAAIGVNSFLASRLRISGR